MRSMKWMLAGVVCLVASPLFAAKAVCGDGKCQGNEPKSCPADCTGPGTYTAELEGAFVFRDADCGDPVAMTMIANSDGDELTSAHPLCMRRPLEGRCSTSDGTECSADEDCPRGGTCGPGVWDNAFGNGCSALGGVPDEIYAHFDEWRIRVGGSQVRLSLVDEGASVGGQDCGGEGEPPCWELWIQLRSEEDLEPPPSLPENVGDSKEFELPWVWIWGKPKDKKGRKSDCDASWARLDTPSTLVITAVP